MPCLLQMNRRFVGTATSWLCRTISAANVGCSYTCSAQLGMRACNLSLPSSWEDRSPTESARAQPGALTSPSHTVSTARRTVLTTPDADFCCENLCSKLALYGPQSDRFATRCEDHALRVHVDLPCFSAWQGAQVSAHFRQCFKIHLVWHLRCLYRSYLFTLGSVLSCPIGLNTVRQKFPLSQETSMPPPSWSQCQCCAQLLGACL